MPYAQKPKRLRFREFGVQHRNSSPSTRNPKTAGWGWEGGRGGGGGEGGRGGQLNSFQLEETLQPEPS